MINISSIKMYMYCPMKLYLQTHVDISKNEDYQVYTELKNIKIDIQDLLQKNMRKLKKDMELKEIETALSQNISSYSENNLETIEKLGYEITQEQKYEITNESYFNIKILALKAKKAMKILNKDGFEITEMFFPNCIYSYLIKDNQIDLIGICDKIEIIDGKYYPILFKSSNPPIKGVWDGDAIEVAATALLIEEEFDSEVFVGFVEYSKIKDKRPVVIDMNLRKSLFGILNETKEIIINKKIPKVKISEKKCKNCEYYAICTKD
ncbi:Dna2/Cas4 domain-containing protein [uncultured Methanobrevibacter sp.]|uniref:CRISPR-associated protein Cas4 n=1 Tax=uncultured Methanobrevibacter sp. TaxID=253161 RepID=UPI002619363E|nr:Dna2/Cas4 domain-containing protein [uncultured Methanobrevibacter sp.]